MHRSLLSFIPLCLSISIILFAFYRDAHESFYEILSRHRETVQQNGAVVHCFTGTEQEAKRYLDLGCYIGAHLLLLLFLCISSQCLFSNSVFKCNSVNSHSRTHRVHWRCVSSESRQAPSRYSYKESHTTGPFDDRN